MLRCSDIKKLIGQGQYQNAHRALDHLLSLGPSNLDGLKLRGLLYAYEGRFYNEAKIWTKVFDLDKEDQDALDYLQRLQTEQAESIYFTDYLPSGGRSFIPHPHKLITASSWGLLGCVTYLLISTQGKKIPLLETPFFSFGLFFLCVGLPWLAIIYNYFKGLFELTISNKGISFISRTNKIQLNWHDLSKIYLAHDRLKNVPRLSLILISRKKDRPTVEINLNLDSSIIRTRSLFVNEIKTHSGLLTYTSRDKIPESIDKLIYF